MQFTKEILDERRQGVGSSEVAALFGLGYAGQTPLSLYLEKRGELDRTLEQTEAMTWGSLLEEPIADEWSRRTSIKIRKQPMMKWAENRALQPMFASIDRQIIGHPRGPGVLEVKNYSEWTGRAIESIEDVPPRVLIQVQHQLSVLGYTWGVIAMLVGGNRLLTFEVERDEEAITQLITMCQAFMLGVQQGMPPAVDAHSDSVLASAYAKGGDPAITSTDENLVRIAQELTAWKTKTKEAEDEWELRKNVFKLVLRNAEEILLPGYGAMAWGRTKDKPTRVFNEGKFKADHADLYETYLEKTLKLGHRTFRDCPDKKKES